MYDINGKVALITGAASGIGLDCAKKLFKNGLKGAVLVDINNKGIEEIIRESGPNKCYFHQADVTNFDSFEDAFKKAVEIFNQLDIVMNCAGIVNEKHWPVAINVNVNGSVNGSLLALDKYLPKYKKKNEDGIIINVSSVMGLDPISCAPIYSGTKHFILGFSRSIGSKEHYERTNVRVLTICPGVTDTAIVKGNANVSLGPDYYEIHQRELPTYSVQEVDAVSNGLIDIIKTGKPGSVWIVEGGEKPSEISFQTRFERKIK